MNTVTDAPTEESACRHSTMMIDILFGTGKYVGPNMFQAGW